MEIWLPASGHRFYRRHNFTDFNLFLVKVYRQFGKIIDRKK
jgi:hypothetical protein